MFDILVQNFIYSIVIEIYCRIRYIPVVWHFVLSLITPPHNGTINQVVICQTSHFVPLLWNMFETSHPSLKISLLVANSTCLFLATLTKNDSTSKLLFPRSVLFNSFIFNSFNVLIPKPHFITNNGGKIILHLELLYIIHLYPLPLFFIFLLLFHFLTVTSAQNLSPFYLCIPSSYTSFASNFWAIPRHLFWLNWCVSIIYIIIYYAVDRIY